MRLYAAGGNGGAAGGDGNKDKVCIYVMCANTCAHGTLGLGLGRVCDAACLLQRDEEQAFLTIIHPSTYPPTHPIDHPLQEQQEKDKLYYDRFMGMNEGEPTDEVRLAAEIADMDPSVIDSLRYAA